MTNTGINMLDLYVLTYEGIKVVFQVCDTTEYSVFLIELATKKYKDGYTLTKNFRATRKPLIVTEDNVFSRSNYKVNAIREDKKLPIKVSYGSALYLEALKYVDYPKVGTFLAVPFIDYLNTYWKKPKDRRTKQCKSIKFSDA